MPIKEDSDVLFGPPIVTETRYGRDHDQRPWLTWEELLPWAVLVPCRSKRDYTQAAVGLCHALKRAPHVADASDFDDKCVTTLHNRMVTRHMDSDEEYGSIVRSVVDCARTVLAGWRTGLELTWAERDLIGRYAAKFHNGRAPVPLGHLLNLCGRGRDDFDLFAGHLDVVRCGEITPDDGGTAVTFRSAKLWSACARVAQNDTGQQSLWDEIRVRATGREYEPARATD